MFNSPVLDVAIGLVFIFLLYSLLATSIKEAIATIFSLRANMLKKGIVEGMLSDSSNDIKWVSILKGIWKLIIHIFYSLGFIPKKKESEKKLGDKFFDHPLIRNYGSNRIFALPSYISNNNFSTVLLDVLKQDFNKKQNSIEKLTGKSLQGCRDIIKIKELLGYYASYYFNEQPSVPADAIIDKDTCSILIMHLKNSIYDLDVFCKKLEDWFNDTMNRVSGWYKRQAQFILFMIGLVLAIVFNVDTIQISGKLTTDKDARDKMVQLAIKASDQFKDDPKVKKIVTAKGDVIIDTTASNSDLFKKYQDNVADAKNLLNTNINSTNNLLAIGWGDFGKKRDSLKTICEYKCEFDDLVFKSLSDTTTYKVKTVIDTINARNNALSLLYNDKHWIKLKVGYVIKETFKGKKVLGFLILAFAVCLGAPFWFDMLNKLIKLRGSGKKEDTSNSDAASTNNDQTNKQPVTVNVNSSNQGEEAVG